MYIKRAAAVVAAGIVLAAAMPTFADAAESFKDVLVRNTDSDPVRTQESGAFSSHVFIRTRNEPGTACFDVPLPAGPVVIEHVDAQLGIDGDAYLRIPTATNLGGNGVTGTLGELFLPASRANIQTNRTVFGLASAIRLDGAFVATDGAMYHTAHERVQLCAFDGDPNLIGLGSAVVSGRSLR